MRYQTPARICLPSMRCKNLEFSPTATAPNMEGHRAVWSWLLQNRAQTVSTEVRGNSYATTHSMLPMRSPRLERGSLFYVKISLGVIWAGRSCCLNIVERVEAFSSYPMRGFEFTKTN